MEQNDDLPLPQVVGKILEVIKDTLQERVSQRLRRPEQIVHVRMPRILEEIVGGHRRARSPNSGGKLLR